MNEKGDGRKTSMSDNVLKKLKIYTGNYTKHHIHLNGGSVSRKATERCASQKYNPQNLYPITTRCGGQSLKVRFGAEWRDIAQYQKVSVDGIFDP